MRNLGNVLVVCMVGALLGLAVPAFADDDVVGLRAIQQVRIGNLTLEPGNYLVRSISTLSNHRLVVVTDTDGRKLYGVVLANLNCSVRMMSKGTDLIFDEADPTVLRAWVISSKWIGYEFSRSPVPRALEARVQEKFPTMTATR